MLDEGIVVIASAMIFWALSIAPTIVSNAGTDIGTQILSVAYPVMDLMLLFALIELLFRRIRSKARPILLFNYRYRSYDWNRFLLYKPICRIPMFREVFWILVRSLPTHCSDWQVCCRPTPLTSDPHLPLHPLHFHPGSHSSSDPLKKMLCSSLFIICRILRRSDLHSSPLEL